MEESTPQQAASRYRKIIDGYKAQLRNHPELKLSEYCRSSHTNYSGVIDWTKRHGISVSPDDVFGQVLDTFYGGIRGGRTGVDAEIIDVVGGHRLHQYFPAATFIRPRVFYLTFLFQLINAPFHGT